MSLSAKQAKAVTALINGDKVAVAAKKAGVVERTVYDWLTQPEYKRAVNSGIAEIYESVIASAVRASTKGIEVLEEIVTDPDSSNRDRISAIKELLTTAERWQQKAIEQRISAIEEALGNGNP